MMGSTFDFVRPLSPYTISRYIIQCTSLFSSLSENTLPTHGYQSIFMIPLSGTDPHIVQEGSCIEFIVELTRRRLVDLVEAPPMWQCSMVFTALSAAFPLGAHILDYEWFSSDLQRYCFGMDILQDSYHVLHIWGTTFLISYEPMWASWLEVPPAG